MWISFDEPNRWGAMRKGKRYFVVMVPLAVLVFLIGIYVVDDKDSKRQVIVLKQLAADTPRYPSCTKLYESQSYKHGRARFSIAYRSPASNEDVKAFYVKNFLASGWQLSSKLERRGFSSSLDENQPVLRKGQYQVAIITGIAAETPGERAYAIWYVWEPP